MPELLDITPTGDQHPTRAVTVGETVRPAWILPVEADLRNVVFDFVGSGTARGEDLEKRQLDSGEWEYRPRFGHAPVVRSTYQLVNLRLEGDPGHTDSAVIHAEPAPG